MVTYDATDRSYLNVHAIRWLAFALERAQKPHSNERNYGEHF